MSGQTASEPGAARAGSPHAISTAAHTYPALGREMTGFLAAPACAGRRPGIVVVHEATGLGDHVQHRASRLAELGYVALAADMFGTGPGEILVADGRRLTEELAAAPARIVGLLEAAIGAFRGLDFVDERHVAVIGYCFGGTAALELARSGADVAAVACFHGRLTALSATAPMPIAAQILICVGAEDPMIPRSTIDGFAGEMAAAGADWRLVLYGGTKHAFTDIHAARMGVPGVEYSELADRRSWTELLCLLEETLTGVSPRPDWTST